MKRLIPALALIVAAIAVHVIERPVDATYTPSFLQSVQCGTITINSGATSGTATITSVDTTRTALSNNGYTGNDSSGSAVTDAWLTLTNATTVTATRSTNTSETYTSVVRFCALQFLSGLTKSIQIGTATIAANQTSGNATITSVNTAKAWPLWLGQSSECNSGGFSNDRGTAAITLSGATTVTATRNTLDANFNCTVGFEIIEGR